MDPRVVLDPPQFKLWLESHFSDVDNTTSTGMPLLHCAVFYRQFQSTQYLVSMGASLDSKDLSGNTALHIAVMRNYPELVQYLLECQASPDIPNGLGLRPLHLAVKKNDPKMISLLLHFSASPNLPDTDGKTPLFYVTEVDVFKELLAASASLNWQNKAGQTALMCLLHRYTATKDTAYRDMLNLALSTPDLMLGLVDADGKTIYHHAVICEDWKILGILLQMGSVKHLKIRDRHGETCFDLAKRLGYSKAMNLLLEKN